jgi:hypothetical protein
VIEPRLEERFQPRLTAMAFHANSRDINALSRAYLRNFRRRPDFVATLSKSC